MFGEGLGGLVMFLKGRGGHRRRLGRRMLYIPRWCGIE